MAIEPKFLHVAKPLESPEEMLPVLKHIDMALFCCRCCGKVIITEQFAALLRSLNEELERKGWSLRVNSGYRCQKHNAEVGGHMPSRHMTGEAVDLHPVFPERVTPRQLKDFIDSALRDVTVKKYNGGLGLYSWGVHVDIGKPSRWAG